MKQLITTMLLLSMLLKIVHASTLDQETLALPITTLAGETINLGQYKNNTPVYLKFWATWCQPCRKQMPHFQHTQEKYGEKIKVIAINLGVNDSIKRVNETKNEFGLSMPIAIDSSGKLAQAFNLIGTPYHVLIDKNGNIVHTGFEASKELDKKIQLLIAKKPSDLADISVSSGSNTPIEIKSNTNKLTALFFTATWCDWYLKDSRPAMSKNCIDAQNAINTLYQKFPEYNWIGITSRLWTGEKELNTYKKKYKIVHPIAIDTSNDTFFTYKVKKFPTLILIKNGKELVRIAEFDDQEKLIRNLKLYSRD